MMKNILFSISLFYVFVLLLSSCDAARDDVYNPYPEINISNMTESGVVSQQMLVGDTLKIAPVVQSGDTDEDQFEYYWYKQSSTSLRLLSREKVLSYLLDSLGVLTIRLEVENIHTHIKSVAKVSTQVVSKAQRGWYVLKETGDGNTDMDAFILDDNDNVEVTMNDIFAGKTGTLIGKPVSLLFTSNYRWKTNSSSYYTSYLPIFIPISEKTMLAYKIDNENVLMETEGLFYDQADANSPNFSGAITNPIQSILVNNGKAHIMQYGAPAFLSTISGDYELSPYLTESSKSSSEMMAFDNKSSSFAVVHTKAQQLFYFPNTYLSDEYRISSNNMNGSLSFMENTDGNLNPDTLYAQRAYALFHENNRNDRCVLLGLDLAQVDPQQSELGNAKYSPIMYADTISYALFPSLKDAKVLTLHKNHPILYYASGNKVNEYKIEAKDAKEGVLTFPSDEEVTYMKFVECTYNSGNITSFSRLLIATYTPASSAYRIYQYIVAGDSFTLYGKALTGKGKIKTMMYASPYTYAWEQSLYRYY